MSTHSDESDVTAKHEDIAHSVEEEQEEDMPGSNGSIAESFSRTRPPDEDESVLDSPVPELNGTSFQGYSKVTTAEEEEGETDIPSSPTLSPPARRDVESPGGSASIPDDTPSRRESIISSPGSSRAASQMSIPRIRRPGALQPFDRRFSAQLSPSPLASPRNISPAFLTSRSRQASVASTILVPSDDGSDTPQPPWEVVRWTKLRKITGQAFSEIGKRNYGQPTVLAVSASIAIGTSKGLTLIFDYHQNLTATIGLGTKAVESGAVTSLAVSADHSTIASGHANGHIFTWEIARPAKPFLHILPIVRAHLDQRKSDGHVSDTPVVHVGFLGTRHTALVSADEGGMAFSHLATRGLGAVGRVVKTTRILGRYPVVPGTNDRPRKASSVLAFSPLPLGNVEQATDGLGLTALLTPYLLVIVSTTPIAETQFKTSRPKEVAPHSALSGSLSWFPAVKLKKPLPGTQDPVSKTKLVYCWSNVLTILEVNIELQEEKDKPAILHFKPRSRWKAEEAIVGVQWLHRSVLGILTISQRLIILEDPSLRVTDSFDLIHKHIFHQDLFSKQLQSAVEQLDDQDQSMHGVVADAFHMSYKAYKGRLFLLGFNDLSLGTLSNWADRLLALMEEGDVIAAIQLATAYYGGENDKISVGLPEDDDARHAMVQEKLLDMISASLKYMFGRARAPEADEDEQKLQLRELAIASFTACMRIQETDFLFDEVYEAYRDSGKEETFFEVLEPDILDEEITAIPPDVLKDLIAHYASKDKATRLEEMICHLDTRTMDIHQTATLCKQYRLYDALIYVWNQAIGDFVTPMIELMFLIKMIEYNKFHEEEEHSRHLASAMKIFPYLAYVFTGRIYPSGVDMNDQDAQHAKTEAYGFLFSGSVLDWPAGSGQVFHTRMEDDGEPAYPYLSLILRFDTPSFMSMLNEAFEDHFLNGPADESTNGLFEADHTSGKGRLLVPTRQTIISILLDVLGSDDFDAEDSIYLDMFIARNLPKFPQFIVLPGNVLHKVLERLCNPPSEEVADDCQLSVEYLLSFYHPPDLTSLIPLFQQAGFFRVLKTVYRAQKQYPELLQTYFDDPKDRDSVFDCVADCLRPGASLTSKQRKEVETVVLQNAPLLVAINTVRAAQTLQTYAPRLIEPVLDRLEDGSHSQFIILRTIMEPSVRDSHGEQAMPNHALAHFEERYVRLMCKYDRTHVADYIGLLKSGDLRLQEVLPVMESTGVIDAAVVLMTRDGLVQEAMERLVKHMQTLEVALTSLIDAAAESPDKANTFEAVDDLLEDIQKYTKVGIWLCQGQTQARPPEHHSTKRSKRKSILLDPNEDPEAELLLDERLWLSLLDTIVSITKNVTASLSDLDVSPDSSLPSFNTQKITSTLRTTVQTSFSALLTSTTRPQQQAAVPTTPSLEPGSPTQIKPPSTQPHPSFLLILRAFLSRAAKSSPTLADLRQVLQEIFAAYTFEENVLSLSNRFLSKDLFAKVEDEWIRRQRGWRPVGYACGGCRKRVWGPGVGGMVVEEWERRRRAEYLERVKKMRDKSREREESQIRGKGKVSGRAMEPEEREEREEVREGDGKGPLVVFACRHVWHRQCLEKVLQQDAEWNGELRCPAVHSM